MMLSAGQQALAVQLNQLKDTPASAYQAAFKNSKTTEMVRWFEAQGLLTIDSDSQEVHLNDEKFTEVAQANGLVDETGQLTDIAQPMVDTEIVESFPMFVKLLKRVSF